MAPRRQGSNVTPDMLTGLLLQELASVGFFFFQAEDGIRDVAVTGVQTCALPIFCRRARSKSESGRAYDGKDLSQSRSPRSYWPGNRNRREGWAAWRWRDMRRG